MSVTKITKALHEAEASGFSCCLVNGHYWWRDAVKDEDRGTVTIPSAQYEALMAAAKALRMSVDSHMLHFQTAREALASVHAAGIDLESKT